jgi:hypothetical protein
VGSKVGDEVGGAQRLTGSSARKDVAHEPLCGSAQVACRMRLIARIEELDVARKILEHLVLRAEALPTPRAQAPPFTLELFADA